MNIATKNILYKPNIFGGLIEQYHENFKTLKGYGFTIHDYAPKYFIYLIREKYVQMSLRIFYYPRYVSVKKD